MIKELRDDFPTARSLPFLGKRASSPPPRHCSQCTFEKPLYMKDSWTPCRSSPLHLGLYLYDAAQYSGCGPQRPRGCVSHRAWPRSFIQARTISRVSILGAVFIIAGLLRLIAALNRSSYATEEGVARQQPIQFSHEHHVSGLGIDCRYCHTAVEEPLCWASTHGNVYELSCLYLD